MGVEIDRSSWIAECVTIWCDDRVLGIHQRHYGRRQALADPARLKSAANLRLRVHRLELNATDEGQVRRLRDCRRLLDE